MPVVSPEESIKRKTRRAIRGELDERGMSQIELANMIGEREDEVSRAINGYKETRFVKIREKIFKLFNIQDI